MMTTPKIAIAAGFFALVGIAICLPRLGKASPQVTFLSGASPIAMNARYVYVISNGELRQLVAGDLKLKARRALPMDSTNVVPGSRVDGASSGRTGGSSGGSSSSRTEVTKSGSTYTTPGGQVTISASGSSSASAGGSASGRSGGFSSGSGQASGFGASSSSSAYVAANDRFVCVTVGSNIYEYDAETLTPVVAVPMGQ